MLKCAHCGKILTMGSVYGHPNRSEDTVWCLACMSTYFPSGFTVYELSIYTYRLYCGKACDTCEYKYQCITEL